MVRKVIGIGIDEGFFDEIKAAAEAEGVPHTTFVQNLLTEHFYPGKAKNPEGGKVKMADEEKREKTFCPECFKKDFEIKETKRDHQAELEKVKAEAERLKSQVAEVKKTPEVENWFEHQCTDPHCAIKKAVAEHDQQIAANVLANLSKPENKARVQELMKQHKIEEFPDKFVIKGLNIGGLRK